MSPLNPVRPTMAPEVTVEAVSAKANWNRKKARNATWVDPYAGVMPCRKKYWCPMRPLPVAELEGEPEGPVQEAAQAGVEHALHEHVHRLPGPGEAGLEAHEPGLHEEHQEGGHQHPHRVDRADQVVRLDGGRCGPAERRAPTMSKYHATPFMAPRIVTSPIILPPMMAAISRRVSLSASAVSVGIGSWMATIRSHLLRHVSVLLAALKSYVSL